VNAANRDGRTALMLAAMEGDAETVTALPAAPGLDVNAADGDGRTALDLAETRGHIEVTSILPSRPPSPSLCVSFFSLGSPWSV